MVDRAAPTRGFKYYYHARRQQVRYDLTNPPPLLKISFVHYILIAEIFLRLEALARSTTRTSSCLLRGERSESSRDLGQGQH